MAFQGTGKMNRRRLGDEGPVVSAVGLGSFWYGTASDEEVLATIRNALDLGVTFVDTADVYAKGHGEVLVGRAIRGRREEVLVATKFGNILDDEGRFGEVCGRPEYVKKACEASLRRLGVDVIDIYFQHRVDIDTPIEETIGAVAELVAEGKVRYAGLSEAGPETIRRAAATHPIAALQSEYSLISRDVEEDVLPTVRELGIGFVGYSPLGRGLLTGSIRDPSKELESGDHRLKLPRFQGQNFERNLEFVDRLGELAEEKGCTLAQLAISWVLAQGNDIVPIVGTKRRTFLEENLRALEVDLTDEDLTRLEEMAPPGVAAGDRYPPAAMTRLGL